MESSNSNLLYERGAIPWFSDHMRIGAGFDIQNFQTVRSPFRCLSSDANPERSRAGASISIDRQLIRDQESLQKYISSSTRVLASGLPVASMQLSLDCLKSAKCDSNNATVILHATVTLPPDLYQDQMVPLPEASNFLEQATRGDETFGKTFQEKYGQYCITGQRRRSSFFAVSTYSSESKEDLDQYVAGVSASFKTPKFSFSATTKVEIGHTMTSKSIKERHQICLVGVDSENMSSRLSTIDLQAAWVDFLEYFKPTPYLALMTPYIDLNIPLPRPTTTHIIPRGFEAASELIFALQLTAQTHGMIKARAAVEEVVNQNLRVCDVQSWLVLPPAQTAASVARLQCVQVQLVTIWHDRLMLLNTWRSLNLTANDWGWFHWNKACHNKLWKIGLCPSDVPESIRSEITTHDQQWHIESKWNGLPECQYEKVIYDLPGRIIIGAQVSNFWAGDGTNGWFKRILGGLDCHNFGVEFKTQHYRGGSWGLTLWSVDRELYQSA
ncbi:uncharacterized protein Bfra_000809 [Botrytis fragariae]|uniref:MACPF domain-containing protein n=1 Tax=Botrytis fragariae TaxID=1964551 RepID=A0A8H6ENE5_9HELO|nr:uncharacterized protein Bfra_000809 [Botrytis fragariae]KAF5878642.1 hypothetical protein Bfra_000809 [Botrytis fragariae]